MDEPTWVVEQRDRSVRDELDRLHPERVALRPSDVAGVVAAFDLVDSLWAPTLERARSLPSELLHERVDGEYSFVETLRHLVFATDAWLLRVVLRARDDFHPWGVPPDLPPDAPADVGPGLEPVLELRAEQHRLIRAALGETPEEALRRPVSSRHPDRWPQGSHRPIDCYRLVLREEWWHHGFAERDLDVVARRA